MDRARTPGSPAAVPGCSRAAAAAFLAALLGLSGAAAAASAVHDTGPPPGHTGGFGEPSCHVCHIGSDVNAFGGSVRIEGLPEAYAPGETYVLTVVLRADETVSAGFQLSARYADGPGRGRTAGVLASTDVRALVVESETGRYLQQSEAGAPAPSPDGSSWSGTWQAPSEAGPVAFHVAANSGNGDDSPLGDLVFTAADTLRAGRR